MTRKQLNKKLSEYEKRSIKINKLRLENAKLKVKINNSGMSFKQIHQTKWTKLKSIKKEALKYKTRSTFSKGSAGAYQAASFRGKLDIVCKHMKWGGRGFNPYKKGSFYLYRLHDEFLGFGIANDFEQRHKEHVSNLNKVGITFEVLDVFTFDDGMIAKEIEQKIKKDYNNFKRWVMPVVGFKTECLKMTSLDDVLTLVKSKQ